MNEIYLKEQQANLLTYIFALCSDSPDERLIGERGSFELMKELDESVLNLAVEFYSSLRTKADAYTKGTH